MSFAACLDQDEAPYWSNVYFNSVKSKAVIDNCNAVQIQGRDISSNVPADTNVLSWNAGASEWQPAAAGDATSIQGVPVSATAPTNNYALVYNSGTGEWEPQAQSGGGGGGAKTSGKVNIFWDNVSGDDLNDGLSILTPVLNLSRAIEISKPLYFDECVINLIYTGNDYIPDAACYTDQTLIPGAESLTQKILDFKAMTKSLKLTFNGILDTEIGTDSGTISYITNYMAYISSRGSSSIGVQITGISNFSSVVGAPDFCLVENAGGVQALLPIDQKLSYKAGNRLFLIIDRDIDGITDNELFTDLEAVTIKYYSTGQMPYFQIDPGFTPIFRTTDSEGTCDLWIKNLYTAFKMTMYSNLDEISYYGCFDEGYLDINTNHYNCAIDANGGNYVGKFNINNNFNGCYINFLTTSNNANITINCSLLNNTSINNANIAIMESVSNLSSVRNTTINFQSNNVLTRITSTCEACIINSKSSSLYHGYQFDGNNQGLLYTLNFNNIDLNVFNLYILNKAPANNTLGATFIHTNTTTELLNLTNSNGVIGTLLLYCRDDQKGVPTMTSIIKLINSSLTNLTNTTNTDTFTQNINIYDVSAASKLYLTGSFSAAVNTPYAIFWIRNGSEFYTPTAATYTNSHVDNYVLQEGADVGPWKTNIVSTYNAPNWWFDSDYQMIKIVKF